MLVEAWAVDQVTTRGASGICGGDAGSGCIQCQLQMYTPFLLPQGRKRNPHARCCWRLCVFPFYLVERRLNEVSLHWAKRARERPPLASRTVYCIYIPTQPTRITERDT